MNLNMVQRSLLAYQQQLGSGNGVNGASAGNGRDNGSFNGLLYNDVPAGASALAGLGATSLLHQRIMAGMGGSTGVLQQQQQHRHHQPQQIQPTNTSPFNGIEEGLPQGIAAALQHMTPDQRAATLANLLGSSPTPPVGGLLGALGAANHGAGGACSGLGLQQQQELFLRQQQQQQLQRSTTPAAQSGKTVRTPSESPQLLNSLARDSPGFPPSASRCDTPSRSGLFPSAASLVNEDKIPASHLLAAAAAATGSGAGYGLLGSGMLASGSPGLPSRASIVLEQQRLQLMQLEEQQQRRRLQQEQHRLFASLRAATAGDGDDNDDDDDDDAMSVGDSRAHKDDLHSSTKRKTPDDAVVVAQRRFLTPDGTTSVVPLKGSDNFDVSDQSRETKRSRTTRNAKRDDAYVADIEVKVAGDQRGASKSGSLPLRKRGPKARDTDASESTHDEEATEEEQDAEDDGEEVDEVMHVEAPPPRPGSLAAKVVSLIDDEVKEEEEKTDREKEDELDPANEKTAAEVLKSQFPNFQNVEGYKRFSVHTAEKKKWRAGGRRYLPGRSPALPAVTNARASGLTKKQRQIVKQQHNQFNTAITRKRRKMATLIEMHLIQILSNEAEREENQRKTKEAGGQADSAAVATAPATPRVPSTKRHQPIIVDPLRSGKVLKLRRPASLASALENRLWETATTEAEYDDISSLPARLRMVCMTVARRIELVAHPQRQPQHGETRPNVSVQTEESEDHGDAVTSTAEKESKSEEAGSTVDTAETSIPSSDAKETESENSAQGLEPECKSPVSEKTASQKSVVARENIHMRRSPSPKGNARAAAA